MVGMGRQVLGGREHQRRYPKIADMHTGYADVRSDEDMKAVVAGKAFDILPPELPGASTAKKLSEAVPVISVQSVFGAKPNKAFRILHQAIEVGLGKAIGGSEQRMVLE